MNAQTFLPRFVIVKTAKSSDAVMARELCAPLQDGEIALFDKAYVDFKHLFALTMRGIFWVTRAKENMAYRVIKKRKHKDSAIKMDADILLTGVQSGKNYTQKLRLIVADVERDGKIVTMEFITNNFEWAPSTICQLYKARWTIETFFKQLKQTLKLSDFLGYGENAVQWQIWTALLTYVILRFIAFQSKWRGTFARLFTTIRGTIWSCIKLFDLLKVCCGTAGVQPRVCGTPQQMYLPLFSA
jgi:hypothetical protein